MKGILNLLIIGVLFSMCSCSTSVILADGTKVARPSKATVKKHMEENNVEALIYDCVCQYKNKDVIYDYLSERYDYRKCSYKDLCHYYELADNDERIAELYDEKIQQYEGKVLESFESMRVDEIGEYYKTHPDEHIFLDEAIQRVYVDQLEDIDYTTLRQLDRSFRNTQFSDTFHIVRQIVKEANLPIIKQCMEEYCSMELEKLDARRGECNKTVLAFFPGTLDRIVDRLLEEDLPVNKGKIASFYGDICSSCFPNDSVVDAISRELSEIGSELYDSRVSLSRDILTLYLRERH